MANYIIKVTGKIIAKDLLQYAQEWTSMSEMEGLDANSEYIYDSATHSVNSDLILDDRKRAVPYAVYVVDKGISAVPPGDVSVSPRFYAALAYYQDNIDEIERQLKIEDISKELLQTLYRGLYTDVFSILELFLSDVLLCMIYSDEHIFKKALKYCRIKKLRKTKKRVNTIMLEKKMHAFFFSGIVYHQFDKVDQLLKKILNIDSPKHKELDFFLHKRNNIVHRYSLSNIDRMRVIEISKEEICKLIDASNLFVNELIEKIKQR